MNNICLPNESLGLGSVEEGGPGRGFGRVDWSTAAAAFRNRGAMWLHT